MKKGEYYMALKPSMNQNPYQAAAKPPYGLDGWLLVIQYHMALYVLMTVIAIIGSFSAMSETTQKVFYIIEIALSAFQLGLIFCSFILLRFRMILFRVFYTILLSTYLLTALLSLLAGDFLTGIYNTAICIGWIVYLYKSQRVKNTLRKLGQAKTDYELKQEQKAKETAQTAQKLQSELKQEV